MCLHGRSLSWWPLPRARTDEGLVRDADECRARAVPLREQLRHKLLSRYRAPGLLGAGGAGDVFGGLGPAKPDPRRPDLSGRDAMREELVALGDLIPVEVEGVRGKRFVVREEAGFAPRRAEGFVEAMRDALRAYLRFAGASRLQWAPHLTSEKRLFRPRP